MNFGLGKHPARHTRHPWLGAAQSMRTPRGALSCGPPQKPWIGSIPIEAPFQLCRPENHTDACSHQCAFFEFFPRNQYVFRATEFDCVPKFLSSVVSQGFGASFLESTDHVEKPVATILWLQLFQNHRED